MSGRVIIAGTGALGTVIADHLCRAGVGHIRLIDRDTVDISNLQRQILFDEEDARHAAPKAVAAACRLAEINSDITVEPAVADLNSSNIDRLCGGADLILDGSDNMELRCLINEYCVKNSIPWIYGAAVMAGGASMNIIPGKTACLRCLYPRLPAPGANPACATSGVLAMITGLIGAVCAAEALKILTDAADIRTDLFMADLWQNSMEYITVERNPACPVCARDRFEFLEKIAGAGAISLCGKDAFQITPAKTAALDFAALAEKLGPAGSVEYSRYMLSFESPGAAFQLFPDGRAIIQRVKSEAAAKTVYSEYIGL
jgi:adenylyltransferase/sulfurtransferase